MEAPKIMKPTRRERKEAARRRAARLQAEVYLKCRPSPIPPSNSVVCHVVVPIIVPDSVSNLHSEDETEEPVVVIDPHLAYTRDRERRLDRKLRDLYLRGILRRAHKPGDIDDLERMRFYVDPAQLLRSSALTSWARAELRCLVPPIGREEWELFRKRIRSEGALERIRNGTISVHKPRTIRAA